LSLVLAVMATMTAIPAAYLAAATLLRFSGYPLPPEAAPVTVTMILLLEVAPVLSAVYLRWLRQHRSQTGGLRSPPPWSKDD
jgi:hypothetical protein